MPNSEVESDVEPDEEMEAFQRDLLDAVREMRAGQPARQTRVELSPVAKARALAELSEGQFATLMGVSVRTLQQWEQGQREPLGAAKTLLRVVERHPEVLAEVAQP
jgi:putative transcriptional regulator